MPALDSPLIDRFLDALWLQKGLSDNTRDAYRSDLALFNGWLAERDVRLEDAGRANQISRWSASRPPSALS